MIEDYKIIFKKEGILYDYYKAMKDNYLYFIKYLKSNDPDDIKNLSNEVLIYKKFCGKIPMPRVVNYELENEYYVAYTFLKGEDLYEKLLDVKICVDYAIQLCNILNVFHESGYIYGDLKSNNIIINDNKLYIVDLGSVTKIGEPLIYATKRYCSPYQQKDVKAKVQFDFYSLGVLIFELIVGKYGKRNKKYDMSEYIVNINKDLNTLVMKLTSDKIEDNFTSIIEIKKILQNIINEL